MMVAMTKVVSKNDIATDSNVIGKVLSSYDDGVKFVEECAKCTADLLLVIISCFF